MSTGFKKNLIRFTLILVCFFGYSFFAYALTTEYVPLVGIPGIDTSKLKGGDMPGYINAFYLLLIAIGSLIGFSKFVLAGVKYALSDIVTSKEEAKSDMRGVLLGLSILLVPYVVLYQINPDLVSLEVLNKAKGVELNSNPSSVEILRQFNQASADTCDPSKGKLLPPICKEKTTDAQKTAASSCAGYYDLALSKCLSRDSTQTYNTTQGGNFNSRTDAGWVKLCGGEDKVDIKDAGDERTYSCK
jgi:hypothetical protein